MSNTTNTTASHYTLPPLSQQHLPKQRLPSLVGSPSTYETSEDTTMAEASDTGGTLDMKQVIKKHTQNQARKLAVLSILTYDTLEYQIAYRQM